MAQMIYFIGFVVIMASIFTASAHSGAFVGPWGIKMFGGKFGGKTASSASSGQENIRKVPETTGSSKIRNLLQHGVPPTLLLLFGTAETVQASPLNQQAVLLKSPFFQGWLVRVTDHENSGSFVLIVGSFSMAQNEKYDEHYIFCGFEGKKLSSDGFYASECAFHSELFPSEDTVTITGGKATTPLTNKLPFHGSPLVNITWAADGIGHFKFEQDSCEADLDFKEFRLRFNATNRLPWGNESHANSAGPEGWLGYTSLLPCHYFVHSVGSACDYSIELPIRDSTEDFLTIHPPYMSASGRKVPTPLTGISSTSQVSSLSFGNPGIYAGTTNERQHNLYRSLADASSGYFSDWSVLPDAERAHGDGEEWAGAGAGAGDAHTSQPEVIRGKGWAHIEGNHGTFFPEGWVWSQAVNEDNSASMSLILGKFKIGVVSPLSTVLYVRTAKRTRIFRSTDLDRIKVQRIDHTRGEVALTAISPRDGSKVEVIIKGSSARWVSSALPIHIPTATGFSSDPGCKETYSAVAEVRCFRQVNARRDVVSILRPEYELEEEVEFPLAALEFGAEFLNVVIAEK